MSTDDVTKRSGWLKVEARLAEETPEARALIHELRTHQIELELQNQQLREAQQQLEQSRAEYSDLYDHAPIAYFTLDKHGIIKRLNLAGAALIGRDRRWLTGMPLARAIGCETVSALQDHLSACARRGLTTMQMQMHEGLGFAQLTSVPLFEGTVHTGYRTTIVDVTAIRRSEQQAAAAQLQAQLAEARTSALAQASARLVSSLPGDVTLPSLARLAVPRFAAWSLVEVDGEGLAVAYTMRTAAATVDLLDALEAGHADVDEVLPQLIGQRPQSVLVVAFGATERVRGRMLFGAHETYQSADQLTAQEIGRLVGLALEHVRVHRELQRAVRTREDILSVVSHDLQNSLEAVRLQASLLLADRNGDAEARFASVDGIVRCAESMLRFVREILDLGRIDAGLFTLRPAAEDAAAILRDTVQMIDPLARAAGVQLVVQVPAARVCCDRQRTIQVLFNLLGNAIKFAPHSVVRIAIDSSGDAVVFAVSDDGPGIAAVDLSRVFERNWRASTSPDGYGLGLFIAKAVVEAQGGRIWAESEPGHGSTFRFTLPHAR